MYVVELVLRNVAMPVSVQRKEATDAEKLYYEVLETLKSGGHKWLELSCEQQTEKKAVVWTGDVTAAQTWRTILWSCHWFRHRSVTWKLPP
jgi:hypothetical protein